MTANLQSCQRARSPAAVAYSYIRFSSPEQRRGDSLRRQTEAAQVWCDRQGAKLDATTTLHDLGTSAFRGDHRKNPDRNALAAFLKLVEGGKVARGSFLIIESLDRLSREDIQPALLLVLNLLQSGVRIVQLKPAEIIYDSKSEAMAVMMMVAELSRGNSESKIKSQRIGAAWVSKRVQARNGELISRNGPYWVRVDSIDRGRFKFALIPGRAKIIRRIFSLAASGLGLMRIARKLTEEGLAPFGRLLDDAAIAEYEEDRRRDGKPLSADERAALRQPGHWHNYKGEWVASNWNRSYLGRILNDRRALGEYQPLAKSGRNDGPAIKNYFPAVVDQQTFDAAQVALSKRAGRKGPRVGKHVDLFSQLIVDAVDGGPYYAATKTDSRGSRSQRRSNQRGPCRYWRVLVNGNSNQGRAAARSFPLKTFELAVLSQLREIDPSEVLGESSPATEIASLECRLGYLADRQAQLATELRNGDIPVIAQQLRELKAEETQVAAQLDEARQLAARPLSETWHDLGALLDDANDVDARLRLRFAISRVVDSIYLLVVPHGRDRLAAVQVNFAGGEARRTYIVIHRPPLWKSNGVRPGRWWAGSAKHPDDAFGLNDFDLRNRGKLPADQLAGRTDFEGIDEVADMEAFLTDYPHDLTDRLLAGEDSHASP